MIDVGTVCRPFYAAIVSKNKHTGIFTINVGVTPVGCLPHAIVVEGMKLRKRGISNKNDVHNSDSDMLADDSDHLSNDSGHDVGRPRNGDVDLELKRQRNRDAAARHRLRQQRRLDGLAKKEEILRQQVEEIQLEINTMRSGRLGLPVPS
ncbi:hypothetical protein DL89DRAFT_91385 [Linderina pennispora]|uniref:BZIP domain-containing protein n=1 Tax=Linderina pennispora TaxID=61395 RepID=A0A1Y1WIL8_9FUNG|nr:uncharacterized protein DL89DRAFT_91385 [Linderina pennispora]ORX73322.1 hypothetical protein DL89DRAFT_91385 [Linderina pennispora]